MMYNSNPMPMMGMSPPGLSTPGMPVVSTPSAPFGPPLGTPGQPVIMPSGVGVPTPRFDPPSRQLSSGRFASGSKSALEDMYPRREVRVLTRQSQALQDDP